MPTAGPIRLLIIDDDPDLVVQVTRMLRHAPTPYQIEVHQDLRLPLADRLRAGGIDACLLDHYLHDCQGADVLRHLPHDSRWPPVVVLTGAPDPALADTYLELGAADFLSKDEINPGLLDRTIRYAIQHWNARLDIERTHEALLHSERLATIGRLAAGVAHEYNNLNGVILGGIERLTRVVALDPEHMIHLQRILDSLERSRRISQGLLQLGRTTPPTGTVTDLRRQVGDTLALLEAQLRNQSIQLSTHLPDQPVAVRVNANDIHQVLSNLVTNSIHALWQTTRPHLGVSLQVEDQEAVLQVADNGIGIEAEDLPRVSEPFFSRKGAHDPTGVYPVEIEGTGLGLAVCASLMQQAGGSLTLASTPGAGTTVTVRLPLSCALPTAPVEPPPRTPVSTPGQISIAVVDDNLDLLTLMQESLSEHGFAVTTFSDPLVFLAAAAHQRWDAVLLDWYMPHCSGAEVLTRLADSRRATPLPVIILSGATPDLPDPAPPGIVLLAPLPKPFRMQTLIALVGQALAGS